jgi:YEATS domain-containing protein 4
VPPTRSLTAPPYEVTETGWGEFEIGITVRAARRAVPLRTHAIRPQVEFVPSAECAPVELLHGLKLYHGDGPPPLADVIPTVAPLPVVRERLDEFVFVGPPAPFHAMLAARPPREPPSDAEELFRIATARASVAAQSAQLQAALGLDKA